MSFRTVLATAAAILFTSATADVAAAHSSSNADVSAVPAVVMLASQDAQTQPPAGGDVDIDITSDDGRWFADPLWIAIGIIALLVIALVIGLAARGGGSSGATIVK